MQYTTEAGAKSCLRWHIGVELEQDGRLNVANSLLNDIRLPQEQQQ